MSASREVEVLVIGAGPGGYVAAIRAAQLGKKVLVVEKEKLGGVCLNVGCIPSKALIHAANVVRLAREAGQMGITVGEVKVDPKQLQAWKRSVVDANTNGIAALFRTNKVESLFGTATFTGADSATVKTKDGEIAIKFQQCIVATGSRPVEIPGFKFGGAARSAVREGGAVDVSAASGHGAIMDSTAALDLDVVPKDVVVIGGGFIGLEIGSVLRTLGANVAVVEMLDQILPGQDPDLVRVVERHLKKAGVKIFTKAKAKGFTSGVVEVELADGKVEKLAAEKVLVTVGRRPNTDAVGLDKAGVKLDAKGFVVIDKQLRTSNPKVFAIGDIVPGPMLAHKASKEGLVAAAVIAGKNEELDYRALPWAVFTEPEIATVGLTEEQAKAQGHEVVTGRFPFAANGRAKSTNSGDGFVKIVADKKSDVVLGVHIVGPEASNLIAEAALAIEMGATTEDIALTIHTHPTLPEALMEAAENAHGVAIHIQNR